MNSNKKIETFFIEENSNKKEDFLLEDQVRKMPSYECIQNEENMQTKRKKSIKNNQDIDNINIIPKQIDINKESNEFSEIIIDKNKQNSSNSNNLVIKGKSKIFFLFYFYSESTNSIITFAKDTITQQNEKNDQEYQIKKNSSDTITKYENKSVYLESNVESQRKKRSIFNKKFLIIFFCIDNKQTSSISVLKMENYKYKTPEFMLKTCKLFL